MDFASLNENIRNSSSKEFRIINCCGQRFIATGIGEGRFEIEGVPGNALGAYLNGADVTVLGNAQDAVGDTMNDGKIIVHGSIGDAAGYAMRGGKLYVKGNAGFRAGIHMKEYHEKIPVIMIGGNAGNFLGEYQAGGIIVVLGLGGGKIIGDYPCTGMHGGRMYLRSDCSSIDFPSQVSVKNATDEDMERIKEYVTEFCELFGYDESEVLSSPFTVVTPDSSNPYKQMYVAN